MISHTQEIALVTIPAVYESVISMHRDTKKLKSSF